MEARAGERGGRMEMEEVPCLLLSCAKVVQFTDICKQKPHSIREAYRERLPIRHCRKPLSGNKSIWGLNPAPQPCFLNPVLTPPPIRTPPAPC